MQLFGFRARLPMPDTSWAATHGLVTNEQTDKQELQDENNEVCVVYRHIIVIATLS